MCRNLSITQRVNFYTTGVVVHLPITPLQAYPVAEPTLNLPYFLDANGHVAMATDDRGGICTYTRIATKNLRQYANGFLCNHNSVYLWGNRLAGGNPNTLRVLSWAFATDGEFVWTHMGRVKDADAATFEACDNGIPFASAWAEGYGKDCNSVFHANAVGKARRLAKADPASFRSMGEYCNHGVDHAHVFTGWGVINKAHRASWRYLAHFYSYDEKHIFFRNSIIQGVDRDSFEVMHVVDRGAPFAKDKNHYYWADHVIDHDTYKANDWVRSVIACTPDDMPPIAKQLGHQFKHPTQSDLPRLMLNP